MRNMLTPFFCWLIAVFLFTPAAKAQDVERPIDEPSKLTYFEHLPGGKTRFYFDQHYFLSDKHCPFTQIERDAGFDRENNRFEGDFVDYDLAGKVLLTGAYRAGLKEGEFKAYHGNGQLKWETVYEQDEPNGLSHYYYPDGRPMITVFHGEKGIEIRDYWDQEGKQRVSNGRGRYEMRIEIDGYNEYGAEFITRRGRIRNGKPYGLWMVDFVFPDRTTEFIGGERYEDGRINRSYNEELYDLLGESGQTALLPLPWFLRGEVLIGKKCTIDEHTGFTQYLSELLESWFEGQASTWIEGKRSEYHVVVDDTGEALSVEAVEAIGDEAYSQVIMNVLDNVWWIPSWKDDAYIADTLKVHFDVYHDADLHSLRFGNVRISRGEGN
ncbi:MAG TPA: hypothetical protein VFD72_01025 [Sphingobacteriaceae bacterium]|nr:hypothetical protein [Sphingobacteriaceae bacterium]